jgi:Rhodopirellula transposase DDE domain
MSGQMFRDYEFVKTLIEKTSTKQGLQVIVRIHRQEYPTGIKTDKSQVDEARIQRHPALPKLSYRIAA